MGDPKFTKKKYSAPPHPWQKSRIDEEKELLREFGLRTKSEVWKMRARILNFTTQAKRLTTQTSEQAKKEETQLLERLFKLNLLQKGSGIEDVLGLTITDILERRLQTLIYKRQLANSIKLKKIQ